MNLKNYFKKFAVIILLVALASPLFSQENRIVRVGYFTFKGFNNIDENHFYSGYGYDYLQKIATHTNWKYEYVEESFENCLQLLKEGKIDLVGSLQKDGSREKIYDYAAYDIGLNFAMLVVRADNIKYDYENFESFNGIKVGLLKGNLKNQYFDKYKIENNFKVAKEVYFDDDLTMIEALKKKEVDALVLGSLYKIEDCKVIARFNYTSMYFATTKNNTEILDKLNYALKNIKINDPGFTSYLYQKYYGDNYSIYQVFSKNELDLISKDIVYKVGYIKNWFPLEYVDKNGEAKGILVDIIKKLKEKTGLKFQFVKADNYHDLLNNEEIDLILSVSNNNNIIKYNNFYLSSIYLKLPMLKIENKKNNDNTVGLLYNINEITERDYIPKNYTVKNYKTLIECFKAVEKGEVSSTYENIYVANYFFHNSKSRNFKISLLPDTENLSFGVRKDLDENLLNIINKGFKSITEDDINNIIYKNTTYINAFSIKNFISTHIFVISIVLLVFVAIIVFLITFSIIIILNTIKKSSNLLYIDNLTNGENLNSFIKNGKILLSGNKDKKYALVYLNMSKFKYINDVFGYERGNSIIIKIAELLKSLITDGEITARIYSDIFIMLLKYNEKNELKNRLLEINKVLEKNIIDSENKYYCSFKIGVYLFSENDKSIQIAIDKANYAKDQVRELTNENIIFYEEKFRQYFINEKELELMMEKALVEKEFEVYYQPNYELKDNQIINAEALVRWNNPKKGLLYPNEFLPLFCKNGFIKKIDYYVYETVCSNISNWIKQGKKLCPISCNFSKQTILSHNFISQLTSIADKYQVPYSFLEIEISESSTDNVINILAAIINRLKSLGFYITIDNFGVGYSSLSIIQKLNIDIIKLDRRFFDVKKNTSLEKDLLEMLIKVSRKNKIKFICKGVETAENENFLKQIKCIYVQGFKYSKALKEADFEKLL